MKRGLGILILTVLLGTAGISSVLGAPSAHAAETVVVEGAFDKIQDILDSLNWEYELIDNSQFVAYDLSGVKQLYLNCGIGYNDETLAKVKKFVEDDGGYLYASDWSSDYLEQWGLKFSGDGVGNQTVLATVTDPGLKGYIQSELTEDGKLEIYYDLPSWKIIEETAGSYVLLTGDVPAEGSSAKIPDSPLAVTFNRGKGRVIYTTFHNEAGGIKQPGMLKAVEYFAMTPKIAADADKLLDEYKLSPNTLVGYSAKPLSSVKADGITVKGVPSGASGVYLFKIADTPSSVSDNNIASLSEGKSFTVELLDSKGVPFGEKSDAGTGSVAFEVPAEKNDGGDWTFKVKKSTGYADTQNVIAASSEKESGNGSGNGNGNGNENGNGNKNGGIEEEGFGSGGGCSAIGAGLGIFVLLGAVLALKKR
ncbi:MAG: hypothetical protein LBS75_01275 [Synergistaceae bacterium]|nr:hypothetical protein [Synergistaceae bacterium]